MTASKEARGIILHMFWRLFRPLPSPCSHSRLVFASFFKLN